MFNAAEAQRRPGYNQQVSRRSVKVYASSKPYVGSLVANDLKFAIVIARFNELVTKLLLEGALEAFDRHGGSRDEVDVSRNPKHALLTTFLCRSTAHDFCAAANKGLTAYAVL